MVTHLLRHARTAYSVIYRVNGRPDIDVPLDAVGREACRERASQLPVSDAAICVITRFGRTRETAALVLDERPIPTVVEARLNEIDYGQFEGGPFVEYGYWLTNHGPWERPPGSRESQREAVLRMLDGLRALVDLPGPRLVVAHGLLLSIINATQSGGPLTGIFFPEAPYLAPITLSDDALVSLADRLTNEINEELRKTRPWPDGESMPTDGPGLATFGAAEPYCAELDRARQPPAGSSVEVDRHDA
jgi:2,3-bisphosphoglycerate-dependent phosphoglycerate mutase